MNYSFFGSTIYISRLFGSTIYILVDDVFKTMGSQEVKNSEIVKGTLRSAFRADDFKYTALNECHARTSFKWRTE